jgi:hypothetical protein
VSYLNSAILEIRTIQEVESVIERVQLSTRTTLNRIVEDYNPANALALLERIKFNQIGRHPVQDRPLNFIEQVNQTFTYLVALEATAWLLAEHPMAEGFRLAPGAHKAQPFDIMSIKGGLVAAETFASVRPGNNDKIRSDIARLAAERCGSEHRYEFFYSPGHPPGSVAKYELGGVKALCVSLRAFRGREPT